MKTATYLNFNGNTEEAFEFYRSVFGGEFVGGITRMDSIPDMPGSEKLSDQEKNMVMNVQLNIADDHSLMGTDVLESFGQKLVEGNNISIMLQPESKQEMDDLFNKLSAGGSEISEPKLEVWGDYFASFKDKFGIRWMMDIPA